MKKWIKKTKESGYTILFTTAIVGIVSMITMGMANTAYKQTILSAVAKDSTTAFYQADIASECALYADYEFNMSLPNPWTCGPYSLSTGSTGGPLPVKIDYTMNSQDSNQNNKCFSIVVDKTELVDRILTVVTAKGYNICDKSKIRTVERALEVTY